MTSSRGLRLAALLIAAALHVSVCAAIIRQPLDPRVPAESRRSPVWGLYYDAVNSPGPGADFFAVYHAGVQVSRGASPYGRSESPQVTPYYYIFRYHPLVARTLGRAVTALAPAAAYQLWALVTEGVLIVFAFAVWRQRMRPWVRTAAVLVLLLQFPYFLELHMGQFTFVAAAVSALAVLAVHANGRRRSAGVLAAVPLTAMSVLKQFPLCATLGLVPSRAGRLAFALTTGATLLLLSPVVPGGPSYAQFASLNLVDDTTRLYPGNFSLVYQVFATSVFLGVPMGPRALAGVSLACSLVLIGVVAWALVHARVRDVRRSSGTLLAAFFLAYFRVWEHHYTAVLVGGILVLAALESAPRGQRDDSRAVLLLSLFLVAAPSAFALMPADPATWAPAQHYLLAWPKIAGAAGIVLAGVAAPSPDPPLPDTMPVQSTNVATG